MADCAVGFVGFGHMAQMMAKAIGAAKLVPKSKMGFVRRDPHKAKECEQEFGLTATSLPHLVKSSDVLIVAVRPSQVRGVLEEMAKIGVKGKLVMTVAAGIRLAMYERVLGEEVAVVRAMPNVASEIGEGMSVLCYGKAVGREEKSLSHLLFSCLGEVMEVPEKGMDIACGLAGSAPGFVFRLIDAAARWGEKEGLEYDLCMKMIAQSFVGAGRLVVKGKDLERAIVQIATPNGTTEAGFKAMKEMGLEEAWQKVIQACAERSKQLSE